jgi:hypothetical protein
VHFGYDSDLVKLITLKLIDCDDWLTAHGCDPIILGENSKTVPQTLPINRTKIRTDVASFLRPDGQRVKVSLSVVRDLKGNPLAQISSPSGATFELKCTGDAKQDAEAIIGRFKNCIRETGVEIR